MRKDKEFMDMQNQFEKNLKDLDWFYGKSTKRVDKDAKVPGSVFYEDGNVNMLFHLYMIGYAFAKHLYQT